MSTVLVTGGSGFIGSHTLVRLLNDGHDVRTTVRKESRVDDVRRMVRAGGIEDDARLSFAFADLAEDAGWSEAVAGCDYVLHIASPFPSTVPDDENDLIVPARQGALRVLGAARDAGVRRVVQTSSFAAIGYGHGALDRPLDETDWTTFGRRPVSAYTKSKTLAERAAWEFVEETGGDLELSVVNPVLVLGPVLDADYATSIRLVHRLLEGDLPGCPKLYFGVVDVRDVVDLHLRAMTDPAAAGERFLATSDRTMSIREMAEVLRDRMGDAARNVPIRELPSWLVRIVALFDAEIRSIVPELGSRKHATAAKARERLGWTPRTAEEAIEASAESLLRLGIFDPD
jgi:nucleoside-diphosphate-sugar epimerase